MAKEIKMPQLSDTMDSGKIIAWFKNEGDAISRGDILAEVETDKANLEIESFDEGTLLKITTAADETAAVGDVIAVIGNEGEEVNVSKAASPVPAKEQSVEPEITQATAAPEPKTQSVPTATDRIKASPLAKKIASDNNIDLNAVHGSGPNGRIIKKDLESSPTAHSTRPESPSPAKPISTPALGGGKVQLDKMRSTIARRMQESMQQSPHFYMTSVIDMTDAKKLRENLKVKEEFKGLSLNHFIIKAAGNALSQEPSVNAAMQGDEIYHPDQINVGVITAVDDGLLIPVIKQVDQMKLMDVALETRAAISRVRAGRPSANDLSGGTFSISNMGMFDVDNFTAIINPGQGAILAVSSIIETPVVKDGQIVVGLQMKVTLSSDHRIIDGVAASRFLKYFKEQLEIPALLLV